MASEVVEGFKKKKFKDKIPKYIFFDEELEFTSKLTQQLFKENNIHRFTTKNKEIESAIAERFNRTLKKIYVNYMYANNTKRYIDVLDKLVKKYNNSYHRSIKMTPLKASKHKNFLKVYKNLYKEKKNRKPKYKIGDIVKITKIKETFTRSYILTLNKKYLYFLKY